MKCSDTALTTILTLLIGYSWPISSWSSQQSASGTVPVSTVVSVEARHGKDVPALNREDVRVFEGRNRLQVTDWLPLKGDQSSLELLVLIDDASNQNLASQFEDMRHFMNAQPPTTAIAVGYNAEWHGTYCPEVHKGSFRSWKGVTNSLWFRSGRKQSILVDH